MFGNKPYQPAKEKDDKEKSFKDFSKEDKQDLVQTKPDSVIIHPSTKDLVERVMTIRRKGL
jgi:hypothetical protein